MSVWTRARSPFKRNVFCVLCSVLTIKLINPGDQQSSLRNRPTYSAPCTNAMLMNLHFHGEFQHLQKKERKKLHRSVLVLGLDCLCEFKGSFTYACLPSEINQAVEPKLQARHDKDAFKMLELFLFFEDFRQGFILLLFQFIYTGNLIETLGLMY